METMIWVRVRARAASGFYRGGLHWPSSVEYRQVSQDVADKVLAERMLEAAIVSEDDVPTNLRPATIRSATIGPAPASAVQSAPAQTGDAAAPGPGAGDPEKPEAFRLGDEPKLEDEPAAEDVIGSGTTAATAPRPKKR